MNPEEKRALQFPSEKKEMQEIKGMSGKEAKLHLEGSIQKEEPDIEYIASKYEPFDVILEMVDTMEERKKGADNKIIKQEITEIRRRLENQRHGIGDLINNLRTTTEEFPDTSIKQLLSLVENKSEELELTSEQLEYFYQSIKGYHAKHNKVEKYREEYPDDDKLYMAVFHEMPKGKIVVNKGSMSLNFECYDWRDYNFAYSGVEANPGKSRISSYRYNRLREGKNCVGAAFPSKLGGTITITLRDTIKKYPESTGDTGDGDNLKIEWVTTYFSNRDDDEEADKTRVHEDAHLFNDLFVPVEQSANIKLLNERGNAKIWAQEILEVLKFGPFLENEVLARYSEEEELEDIKDMVKEYYFDDFLKKRENNVKQIVEEYAESKDVKPDDVYSELDGRRRWYERRLNKAIDAIYELELKNLDRKGILSFLKGIPVINWPGAVKRFIPDNEEASKLVA